jgi:hypothetical protein
MQMQSNNTNTINSKQIGRFMTFLLLLGLLIPIYTHTEEQAPTEDPIQLSSEQIDKIEQLMDSYPTEELLDQEIIFKLAFVRNANGILRPLTEEEIQEIKNLQFSCDKNEGFTQNWHIPTFLKVLTLNEKLAILGDDMSIASSPTETRRIKNITFRLQRCHDEALSHYKKTYLKTHTISVDALDVMQYYHSTRFAFEIMRLLHNLTQKELMAAGNSTQRDLFKKIKPVTDETIISLKTSILLDLRKNYLNDKAR